MGLSIIKKLIDLQKGKVEVDSEVGEGTVIRVELPVEMTAVGITDSEKSDSLGYSLEGKKVLVVDDDAVGLKLIKLILESMGAKVEDYLGGLNFRYQYENSGFDLAVLDIQMPEVSGLDVLGILKSNPDNAEKPVIAMTANVFADEKNALTKAGFDAILLNRSMKKLITTWRLLMIVPVSSDANPNGFGGTEKNTEEIYDLTDLKKFCMGDEDMLHEVLSDIIHTTGTNLDDLENAVKDDDYGRVREITHQLSSRLGQIRISAGAKAKNIEVAIKNGKSTGLEDEIRNLIEETSISIQKIKSDFQLTVNK